MYAIPTVSPIDIALPIKSKVFYEKGKIVPKSRGTAEFVREVPKVDQHDFFCTYIIDGWASITVPQASHAFIHWHYDP